MERRKPVFLEMTNKEGLTDTELIMAHGEDSSRHLKNIRRILDTLNLFADNEDRLEVLDEISEYLEGAGY